MTRAMMKAPSADSRTDETTRRPVGIPVAVAFLWLFLAALPAEAVNLGDSLIRDYPVSLPLPKKRLEISLDYLRIDGEIGVFDGDEAPPGTPSPFGADLSAMNGFRTFANYGLFQRTTLLTALTHRSFDFDSDELTVTTIDLSWKQNLTQKLHGDLPFTAIDVGVRIDSGDAGDRFDELESLTPYIRLSVGKILGNFMPNLFVEYGHASVDAASPPSPADGDAPDDPERDSGLFRAGICVLWKFPYKAMSRLQYTYHHAEIDGADNHTIRSDISYFLSDHLILNIGGAYRHEGQAGLLPFLGPPQLSGDLGEPQIQVGIGFTFLFGGF